MESTGQPKRCAAIIPAFNEEETIEEVVRVLADAPLIDEILVISDGSSDQTAQRARLAGATRVYEIPNGGKGAALAYGVKQTNAPLLAFFDADLRGLTADHVERLLLPVLSGARVMNVGLRDRGPFFTKLSSRLPLISGERVLERRVFERIPAEYRQGYMVETALSYLCQVNRWRYGSVPLPGLTIRRKYEKVGLLKASIQYGRMFWQIAKAMLAVRLAHFFRIF